MEIKTYKFLPTKPNPKISYEETKPMNPKLNPNLKPLDGLLWLMLTMLHRKDLPDNTTLNRVTPRLEYRKCRDWCFHNCNTCISGPPYCLGPYLYIYWKDKGKLKKKYLGKFEGVDWLQEKVPIKLLKEMFSEMRLPT
jgi:hypothetical protein